jgi:hypothetical protein
MQTAEHAEIAEKIFLGVLRDLPPPLDKSVELRRGCG